MDGDVQIFLIATIFRVTCLLVGLGFGYLGYKLYVKGVFDKTQDIKASFGNAKVALRHVAPGVVFGIAGIVIAILSVVRPVKTEQHSLSLPTHSQSRGEWDAVKQDVERSAEQIDIISEESVWKNMIEELATCRVAVSQCRTERQHLKATMRSSQELGSSK